VTPSVLFVAADSFFSANLRESKDREQESTTAWVISEQRLELVRDWSILARAATPGRERPLAREVT
jgi:hypothetical protein